MRGPRHGVRTGRARGGLLGLGLALTACGLDAPRQGRVLREGPTPVAEALFEVRARHTDVVPVRVVFPSDAEGRPAGRSPGARLPALVFIHGGLVEAGRYVWLAEALAARGFVVALPAHPLDLAISSMDNGRFARELLVAPPEGSLLEGLVDPARVAVGGHSLGGVVSTKLALGGGFGALALLASFPDPADAAALPSLGLPSLVLAGAGDCDAPLAQVREESSRLPAPSVLAVAEGVSHYQFTDSQREDEEAGCAPGVPLEVAHARLAEVLHAFLRAALEEAGTGADAIGQVPGVEVTRR